MSKRKETLGQGKFHSAYSSKKRSRCGWINRELRDALFECGFCGLKMDRRLNAAINLYLKMEGVPHEMEWWDKNILPTLVGGCFLTGAEAADEPARSLYDTAKPRFHFAYDRYANTYLHMPM